MPSPILFVLASLIWGSTFYAITLQLGEVPPAVSVVYRFGLASAILFCYCLMRKSQALNDGASPPHRQGTVPEGQSPIRKLLLPWRAQRWTMLQGFFTFGLSYVCTYMSEQHVVSALVAVLFALMVFWNPIFNRIAFGTHITWRTWAAGVVAMGGVTMLFFHSIAASWSSIMSGGSGTFLAGLALALTATLASSAGNVVVIKVREQSKDLILTMAWSMFWGTTFVTLWALLSGQHFMLPDAARYWAGLLYLSVFGSVIAFFAYFTLIARIGSQKAVYIGVITPVISVLLSIRLEGYTPGPMEWFGMILCLSSVAWTIASPAPKLAQT